MPLLLSPSRRQNHRPRMIIFNQNTGPTLTRTTVPDTETTPQSLSNLRKSSPSVRVGQFSHPFFPLSQQPKSAPPITHEALVSASPIDEVESPYSWTHSSVPQKPIGPVVARRPALSRSRSEKRQWPWSALSKMKKSSPVLHTTDQNTYCDQMRKKTLQASSVAHSPQIKLTKSKSAPNLKPRIRAAMTRQNPKPLPAIPAPLKQASSSTIDEINSSCKAALEDKAMYFTCDFGVDGDVFFRPISPTSAGESQQIQNTGWDI